MIYIKYLDLFSYDQNFIDLIDDILSSDCVVRYKLPRKVLDHLERSEII